MNVLAHRGHWTCDQDKNSLAALERAFQAGFGVETDIRDRAGDIVISHDVPRGSERLLAAALPLLDAAPGPLLALNVKADGLARLLAGALTARQRARCFVFDMAVPDTADYFRAGLPVFVRMSEVEGRSAWLDRAEGVWLDAFDGPWYDAALVRELLALGKRVCVVSEELHGREHLPQWHALAAVADHPRLMICTDHPQQARTFFGSAR